MKGSPRGITSELLGNKDSEFKLIPKWTIPRRAAGPCIYNKASLNFILSRCSPIFAYLQMRTFRSFRGFLCKHFDDTIAISTYDHWIGHFGHDHTGYSIHMVSHQVLLLLDCIRITWGIGWIVSRCEWRPRSWPALDVSELEVEFDTFNCVWATNVTGRMSELVVKWTLPLL
jgi:hypothetical protein